MKLFKYLLIVLGLSTIAVLSNPAKALTSSYNRESQILVIDGVNLDQDFTLTENDLSEILTDRKNTVSDTGSAFKVRLFFSPSVEEKIITQIEANQDQDGASPSLVILKNNDLRTTRTRVKVARVERKKKSFAFLNFINPDSVVKLAISTQYTFDLHDFSGVEDDETVGFEFEVSTANTFSGNIDFKVSLNGIETGSDNGGSSVDNGNNGGSGGGGTTGGGGSGAGTENPATNDAIDNAVQKITDKLGDSFDAVNKTVVCGETSDADEIDVCDRDSLNEFRDQLQNTKNDLRSLQTDNVELKGIINTARKDGDLTKKQANQMKKTLDANNKKIKSAQKEVNDLIKKINKNNGKGFTGVKAQRKLQAQLDKAKNKLSQAHNDLKNNVLRPLLDNNIISQEVYDKYNVDIDEAGTGVNEGTDGSDAPKGTTVTTTSTQNPDGSTVVVNPDGSKTTTLSDGTVINEVTNADGSVTTTTTNPDGSVETSTKVTNADGSVTTTTTHPDGTTTTSTEVTNADGSVTTTTTHPDGTTTTSTKVTNADGSITTTTTHPDGTTTTSTEVTNSDGTKVTTYDDGRVVTESPDGTVREAVTNSDGSVTTTVTHPDGSVSTEVAVTNPDGSVTTTITNPDGTTTTKEAVTNADGSITTTITNPDGSTTTETEVTNIDGSTTTTRTNPDGSTTVITKKENADGSVTTTTVEADGSTTTSVQHPDGSRLVTNPDGSTLETKVDGTTVETVTNADGSVTTTTTKPDGTVITSTKVTNADGSITTTEETTKDGSTVTSVKTVNTDGTSTETITNADGTTTTIEETLNADGSFTVTTTNPDGTSTTSTKVINADGSITTTTLNADGTTTTETVTVNPDGSITTKTDVFTPDPPEPGSGGNSSEAEITASLSSIIEDYSLNVADSFGSIDRNYVCGSSNSENSVDICDIEGIIAFQTNIIEANAKLRTIIVNDSRTLLQTVRSARRSRLISKKRAKRLRFRIKRNNVRIKRARRTLVKLDDRIRARVARGRPFDSAKANKYFLDTISKAQFRINRSYVKLQETVVRPLFNQRLIDEATKARFDVSISELN